jgi:hypothetical protein
MRAGGRKVPLIVLVLVLLVLTRALALAPVGLLLGGGEEKGRATAGPTLQPVSRSSTRLHANANVHTHGDKQTDNRRTDAQ